MTKVLPLRPHSPADLESLAMTELQEKKENMHHYYYYYNPYRYNVILTHISVTGDCMCQRCR